MKYEASWYASPIKLPEQRSGDVRIEHRILKPGETTPVVGMRQAILRGIRASSAMIKEPLLIHQLVHEQRGVWMTDLPEELNQIAELLWNVSPHGRVLIGGLGLGILARSCADRQGVDRLVVIEKDPDVIKLCRGNGYVVVEDDIANYLRTTNEVFDFYLLDTWQGTSASTWWTEVVPLRRIIRQRHGKAPVIHCWAEDIMLGQILQSMINSPPHWYYTGLPVPMKEGTAKRFVREVGLPAWEKKYGAAVDGNMSKEVT